MWKCFQNCHRTQACGNLFNIIRRPGLSSPLCRLQQQSLLNPHSEVSVHPLPTHTHVLQASERVCRPGLLGELFPGEQRRSLRQKVDRLRHQATVQLS